MSAGRYTRESAIQRAEETGELIAFGRRFISNVCCSHTRMPKQLLTVVSPTARPSYSASRQPSARGVVSRCVLHAGRPPWLHRLQALPGCHCGSVDRYSILSGALQGGIATRLRRAHAICSLRPDLTLRSSPVKYRCNVDSVDGKYLP